LRTRSLLGAGDRHGAARVRGGKGVLGSLLCLRHWGKK
jgi:hypothetical protein